jgi:hypothetical protein
VKVWNTHPLTVNSHKYLPPVQWEITGHLTLWLLVGLARPENNGYCGLWHHSFKGWDCSFVLSNSSDASSPSSATTTNYYFTFYFSFICLGTGHARCSLSTSLSSFSNCLSSLGVKEDVGVGCCFLFVTLLLVGTTAATNTNSTTSKKDELKNTDIFNKSNNKLYQLLSPRTSLLAKWLPVFFVPSLVTLPLVGRIGNPIEVRRSRSL